MYHSKLYNSPSYFNTAIAKGDRGYPAVKGASTLNDLNDAWFTHDPFKLDGEADGKLTALKGATGWTTNLGHPGYSSPRSEEHTSELQSLMRISYAVFCLKKKKTKINKTT